MNEVINRAIPEDFRGSSCLTPISGDRDPGISGLNAEFFTFVHEAVHESYQHINL